MKGTIIWGIACFIAGLLVFGFAGPALYRSVTAVAYVSAGSGMVAGIGIALIVSGIRERKKG